MTTLMIDYIVLHNCQLSFYLLIEPIIQLSFNVSGYHSEWGAKIGRIRIRVRKMCKQQWWFWLVVTLVFLNTCTVAVEHYGQPAWLTNFLGKLKVIIKSL